jgi:hypothetical protein
MPASLTTTSLARGQVFVGGDDDRPFGSYRHERNPTPYKNAEEIDRNNLYKY